MKASSHDRTTMFRPAPITIRHFSNISIITLLLLLASLPVSAQTASRELVSLNGQWRFTTDPQPAGWQTGLDAKAMEVTVPHTWNVMKGYEDYEGLAWYEKKFHADDDWKGKDIRIKFAAVYHDAVIWLNGKKVGEHLHAGYTTFYTDITDAIRYGEENTLVVSVSNAYSELNLPYQRVFDWPNDGGIIRDVDLVISGKPSIRYVHVTPDIDFADTSAKTKVSIRLWEEKVKKTGFEITLKEKKTQKVIWTEKRTLSKQNGVFNTLIDIKKVHLWHFNDPFLYQVEVKTTGDQQTIQTGFRKIALEGTKLLVNNEPVRLPGIEYMPSSHPDYGSAEPAWVMDSVVNMMKDLNVVITRFHWQIDEHMLDMMDEKGILVQEEIPWWQQPGKLSPELKETAKRQLSEMIERDYNHPSVFAWGISNEVSSTDSDQYHELKAYVKTLDNNRMANVVSNETFKRKEKDESLIGDLPTWNEYIGTWFGKATEELPAYFKIIESFLGNRPLLITENGLCEPRFPGGDLRRVHDMIYHYSEWAKRDYIVGCIYFSLNDYRTQRGEDGAANLKARIHGITDLYFNKKPSYHIYKQLAAPVEITLVEKQTDTQIKVTLTNKNSLPSYTIRGYKITWKTADGQHAEKVLPNMKPGEKILIELENIQKRFAFEIMSPGGYHVTGYPIATTFKPE